MSELCDTSILGRRSLYHYITYIRNYHITNMKHISSKWYSWFRFKIYRSPFFSEDVATKYRAVHTFFNDIIDSSSSTLTTPYMVKVFPNKLLKQFTIKLNQTQSIVKLLCLTMQEQKTILQIKDKPISTLWVHGAWDMSLKFQVKFFIIQKSIWYRIG